MPEAGQAPVFPSLAAEPDTATHANVQLVVGNSGLFVMLAVCVNGRAEAEIGMTPEEAQAVAAALSLHAAKAGALTSGKPNA